MLGYYRALLNKIYQFLLRRERKDLAVERGLLNYKKINEVGILFNATFEEPTQAVLSYVKDLKAEGKKVSMLAYIDANLETKRNFPSFGKKQINWLQIPKTLQAKRFMNKQFDLLINAYTEECKPLEYIASLSMAKLRIGKYFETDIVCNDFMLQMENEEKTVGNLLEKITFYLKNLNK